MPYHSEPELASMGFLSLGKNVKVSSKCSLYNPELMSLGDDTRIDDFCVVSGRLTLGRNIHITPMCLVAGGEKGLSIGDYSTLAYGVQIFTQSDDYSGETMTNSTIPAAYKNEKKVAMSVGKHVIIGAGATIMPGADLAEGTAIGAKALVLRPTEPWSVYAGVPAQKLRARSRALLELECRFRMEYPR